LLHIFFTIYHFFIANIARVPPNPTKITAIINKTKLELSFSKIASFGFDGLYFTITSVPILSG